MLSYWMIPGVLHFITNFSSMSSVIDNVLDILRAQHTGAISRVVSYTITALTLDDDGTMRAHLVVPEDFNQEALGTMRAEVADLVTETVDN